MLSHYPTPRRVPVTRTIHGRTLSDSYHWMRDRHDPDVMDYLRAENAFLDEYMAKTLPLQGQFYKEMRAKIKERDTSVPEKMGEFEYFTKTLEDQQYIQYCRRRVGEPDSEELLLDVNELAKDHPYFVLGELSVSPNNRYLAYSADLDGSERYCMWILDLQTGETLADRIVNTVGHAVWYNDNISFVYLRLDHAFRAFQVFRHVLGQTTDRDELLCQENDEMFSLDIDKSRDNRFIFIGSVSKTTSEISFIPADQNLRPTVITPRMHGIEYYVDHRDGYFYIRTNLKAKNFSIMRAPIGESRHEAWEEVLANRTGVKYEGMALFQDFMVVSELENGLAKFRVERDGGEASYISFPEECYAIWPGRNYEMSCSHFRYFYSSPITPLTVFDYDVAKEVSIRIKEQEIPSGYDKTQYKAERRFVAAADGTKVPLTLVYRIDAFKNDGSNPAVLYGYGAYGYSIKDSFSSRVLSLLDRGFVYATAHVRGGGEMGEEWYESGKLQQKQNTFTDFIDCAKYLVETNISSSKKIVALGASAGGLLMGAVANMAPQLFGAIMAIVPFVDVMNTMLDPTLPLTIGEYEEWGNPNVASDFEYMMTYSPYDNITSQEYPNILAVAGLTDPRVSYWEPAKWVAKLRQHHTGKQLIALRTKFESGHFGASGRFDYLKEIAFEYAFMFQALGLDIEVE